MTRKLGMISLASWAIATGLLSITNLQVELAPIILGVLLIAAGVLILLDR